MRQKSRKMCIRDRAATDSGTAVLAKNDGIVEKVDADHVEVRNAQGAVDNYSLVKFARSNAGTCINQRPIVEVGENVKAGQVLADGPAMRNGEISLGKNALIGFMTWEGYNYEDAVLLNEKIVREDVYTSIHIEEYETESRDTKLGPEEITRDIPNVSEDALKDLGERGIIRIGAEDVYKRQTPPCMWTRTPSAKSRRWTSLSRNCTSTT